MSVKTPPKPGRYKEQRIIAGTLHNVITENGKVVKDLGAAKKDYEQEQPNVVETQKAVEEKSKVGPPLISEDGSYVDPARQPEETNDNTVTKPNSISQEQKPKSGIQLTPVSVEDLGNIFKQDKQGKQEKQEKQESIEPVPKVKFGKKPEWEDILSKIPEPDPDRKSPSESNIEEQTKVPEPTKTEQKKSHIPIIEPIKKSPQVPKITIPKVQINIPPKNTDEPIKLENISNKLGDILTTDVYQKTNETEVVERSLQKANENTWTQQPVVTREKSTKEKRRSMADDELEAELLDERKFEQWMKKQKFHENLAKTAKFAEDTFEQKIPELSGKIENVQGEVENVHGEVKNVENRLGTVDDRLGTVDKSIGTLCTGIDCVKEDVKKYQTSQEALERLVQDRFKELGEKVQSLDRPTFTCENCGEPVIAPLSSFCPNCGSEIQSWNDEDGQPVRGWSPYWKRSGRSVSQ